MLKTFFGGIHPDEQKELSEAKAIKPAAIPAEVVIPLSQHTGVPCEPLIAAGEQVKIGQRLGDSEKFITAPVHASIGGKVKTIEPRLMPNGSMVLSVVIEGDGSTDLHESIKPYPPLEQLNKKDIRRIVRAAGIVGLGGAAFPTHVKLDPPHDKHVKLVILNGAECEPFLTCDHRTMLEKAQDVILGLKAIMIPTDAEHGIIAIENNKLDAIELYKKLTENDPACRQAGRKIAVVAVKTKYPQGGEKQLIKAVTGKEVPSGGLPMDVGIVVNNVGTAAAIAHTLKTGMPLIERVVTVTGKYLKEPSNLLVRIGTLFYSLIEECGGLTQGKLRKVIMGGPMMGIAVPSTNVPVVKATSGILVMNNQEVKSSKPEQCLRCGKCVDVCPQYIMPNYIADSAEQKKYDESEKLHVTDCIECGCCAYVCASRRNLVQLIKEAKTEVLRKRKK